MNYDRLNLGCGKEIMANACNVDCHPHAGVDLVADVRSLPLEADSVSEVIASSVLEHTFSPYEVLDEIHRVLRPTGTVLVRVPCLGTYAAHTDPTHRFLCDLKGWREILQTYFERVRVSSEGVKYRDNKVLAAINHLLVKVCRFHELAQVWVFRCSQKRAAVRKNPSLWWLTPSGGVSPGLNLSRV